MPESQDVEFIRLLDWVEGRLPEGEARTVEEQVAAADSAGSGTFGVQLLEGTSEVATTATNDLGEFTFEAVAPGVYEVLASNERVELRIPHVTLNL